MPLIQPDILATASMSDFIHCFFTDGGTMPVSLYLITFIYCKFIIQSEKWLPACGNIEPNGICLSAANENE